VLFDEACEARADESSIVKSYISPLATCIDSRARGLGSVTEGWRRVSGGLGFLQDGLRSSTRERTPCSRSYIACGE